MSYTSRRGIVALGASISVVTLSLGGVAGADARRTLTRPALDPLPSAGFPETTASPVVGSPWVPLANAAPFSPGAMLLLTDGTVLVQDQGPQNQGSTQWWRLTPDSTGSYIRGTWSRVASLPANYAPLYFASAVLPDGRVIIEGGEYNQSQPIWTNQGAIYDPVDNSWTAVAPPNGGTGDWVRIGDAPSTVLANGRFMIGAAGYSGTTAEALFNASTLTWTTTGSGKADGNGEEGWSLLPNGKVLTVDALNVMPPNNSEIYSPTSGSWTTAGATPEPLTDSNGEIGPQVLRPNGTVLAEGAGPSNAVYTTSTGKWSAAPNFPSIGGQQYDSADGCAAVLPDGNVLLDASPGEYTPPTHFFLFNGTSLTQVVDPPGAASVPSNYCYMLVLPTGKVLYNDRFGHMDVYVPGGSPNPSWRPRITSVPSTLSPGGTYGLSGVQLHGLTQASAYGDDYQSATNYPLVQITNKATHHLLYARVTGMTSMSVTPNAASSAQFTLPASIGTGPSTLQVVVNGITSAPVSVTVA